MITLLLISYFLGDKLSWPMISLIAATIGLLFLCRRYIKKKRLNGLKEIPGPRALPLIGNLHQFGTVPGLSSRKWAKTYGDIYQVNLGKFETILISNPEWCKEIFSSDTAYAGRMLDPEFDLYEQQPGLDKVRLAVHTQFLLSHLRELGYGKRSMEAVILDEVKEVLQIFEKATGKPVTGIQDTLRVAVVNSLWMLMVSQRFCHDDPKLLKLANNASKAFKDVIAKGGILKFLPWIKKFFPNWSVYNYLYRVLEENKMVFEQTVREHNQNFREDEFKDFIDVYLAEVEKVVGNKDSMFYSNTAERLLVVTIFDMFFASSDTTSLITTWSILYLCQWPEVQRKLQEEIDLVTSGNTRCVSVDDRVNMPYTQATIDEVLRFSSVVPDSIPYRTTADGEFLGYFIPKDVTIQPNLYSIHHSPKFWEDPENFRPERFLSKDGKNYVRNLNLQPFQVGRRPCTLEILARDTVFLFVTNIFQKFSIEFDPNEKQSGVESGMKFLRVPLPFSVIMKERMVDPK